LETMLVDLVATTWLAAQHGEAIAASPEGGSLQQASLRLRRAESSQRRFLNAVRTLTMVRALLPRGLRALANREKQSKEMTADTEISPGDGECRKIRRVGIKVNRPRTHLSPDRFGPVLNPT